MVRIGMRFASRARPQMVSFARDFFGFRGFQEPSQHFLDLPMPFELPRFIVIASLLAAVFGSSEAVTGDEYWKSDPDEAIKLAEKEKKDVLLLFTSDDTNSDSKELQDEVFADDSFFSEADTYFTFAKLEFLENSLVPVPPAMKALNQKWAARYGIRNFPKVVLLDTKGRPYAFCGYEKGGVENYLGLLEERRQLRVKRDKKMAEAKKAKGNERAKLLDEAISVMPRSICEVYYADVIKEIVKLDESDELGLRKKWNEEKDKEIRKAIKTDVMMTARLESPERAIERIDEILQRYKFTPRQQLDILQIKLSLVRELNKPKLLDATLDEMLGVKGLSESARERLLVKKIYLMIGSKRKDAAMKLLADSIAAAEGDEGAFLLGCKAELLDAEGAYDAAVKAFGKAMAAAQSQPDLLAELVSGKADALYDDGKERESYRTLDSYADDTDNPVDLRAQALLHKAMLMRESGKSRTAILAENSAIEIVGESTKLKTEILSLVERLHKKYDSR